MKNDLLNSKEFDHNQQECQLIPPNIGITFKLTTILKLNSYNIFFLKFHGHLVFYHQNPSKISSKNTNYILFETPSE